MFLFFRKNLLQPELFKLQWRLFWCSLRNNNIRKIFPLFSRLLRIVWAYIEMRRSIEGGRVSHTPGANPWVITHACSNWRSGFVPWLLVSKLFLRCISFYTRFGTRAAVLHRSTLIVSTHPLSPPLLAADMDRARI